LYATGFFFLVWFSSVRASLIRFDLVMI